MKFQKGRASWLPLPEQEYRSIALMPDGNLIAGWAGSYYIFSDSGKIIRRLQMRELLQYCRCRPVFDRYGNMYMGGNKGVTVIGRDGSILLTHPEIDGCWVMGSDNERNIWIGAQNRLFRIDGKRIVKFRELNGEITNIFFTRSNKMLVGTTHGIYMFDATRTHFVIYNQLNGYTLDEPARCDMYEDPQDNVWLPSVGGIACFNPNDLFYRQPVPLLHILSLLSSKDNINWDRELVGEKLSYNQKNIRLSYIGLSYSQASNIRYQYRLVGFQNEWSQPISEREITFNNLSPGKYRFELRCNAGTPDTQTDIASVSIEIVPAFWQTWWFIISTIIFGICIIIFIVAIYLRRRHRMELRIANREKEMNELMIQSVRLKSIPHFNSNVLAGIEYFIMTKSKEEANRLLATYSRFTNITLHEIDKAQRSLKDELDYVRMYLELEKMRYGDKFEYDIYVEELVDESIMIPNMVLHTYAENAVKHGVRAKNTKGRVKISVMNGERGVNLSVEDDGVGRAASAAKNAETNRTGLGLSILLRQIELYNQQNRDKIEQRVVDLFDEFENPCGTRFELYVPYSYDYL